MQEENRFEITRMQESHLSSVYRLAEENNLSYWSLEDYRNEISRKDSVCLVAENSRKILSGFIIARLIMTERCSEIYNIVVDNEYRRKKVGQKLIVELAKYSILNDLVKIHLEVRRSNLKAIDFYQKLNFEVIGIRKNFYTQPPEDAVLMSRTINNSGV